MRATRKTVDIVSYDRLSMKNAVMRMAIAKTA